MKFETTITGLVTNEVDESEVEKLVEEYDLSNVPEDPVSIHGVDDTETAQFLELVRQKARLSLLQAFEEEPEFLELSVEVKEDG